VEEISFGSFGEEDLPYLPGKWSFCSFWGRRSSSSSGWQRPEELQRVPGKLSFPVFQGFPDGSGCPGKVFLIRA
jgi:hypothetical protein